MSPDLTILTLHHADEAERRKLFCLIGEFFASPAIRREFGRPMSSTPEYTWLVAMDGEAVAAFAAVRVRRNGKAELCHSYTVPAYRRQGFNGWSIQRRCELAAEQGATEIHTIISPARASKYEALGFRFHSQRGRWSVYVRGLP